MARTLIALLACALAGIATAGPVLLNAGGPFLRSIGWRADTGAFRSAGAASYAGGGASAANGSWAPVYASHAWAATGDLEFRIPVPAGSYIVDLLFAETWRKAAAGSRQFVVKLNGRPLAQAGAGGLLDVFARAGGRNRPVYVHLGRQESVGGFMTVTCERVPGRNNPMISGIAVFGKGADGRVGEEGIDNKVAPVDGRCPEATATTGRLGMDSFAMNVGGPALAATGWGADNTNYIVEADKGMAAAAPIQVRVPGSWGEVYLKHRWTTAASLTYKIPVPAGAFKVSVLHAESFMGRAGQRTFAIVINGETKAEKYDVFALKGKDKPLFRSFPGVKSVDGYITISFKKGVENPFVNGIFVEGAGAGTLAIGGPEDGKCVPTRRSPPTNGTLSPGTPPKDDPDYGKPPVTGPAPPPPTTAPPAIEGPGGVRFTEDFVKLANGTKAKLAQPAVVIYGPDGRMYVGTAGGAVHALSVDKDFTITQQCDTSVQDTVPRAVLGLAFNPRRRGLRLFMSTGTIFWQAQKLFKDFGEGWTNGKVETVTMQSATKCFNDDRGDFITGLPVTNAVHSVNALEFLPNGQLLIAVGGFTNGGVSTPGDSLGGMPANPLSGSIVACYANRFSRTRVVYSQTDDPATAKVVGGGCMPYATGMRNVYGMTLATNGGLYAADNGPMAGAGDFSTDCNGGKRKAETLDDRLLRVQAGKCHGHPNLNRGECVFHDPKCVPPLLANVSSSTNGVLEYRSNTFGGRLRGNLFLSRYALKDAGGVGRVVLDARGGVAAGGFTPSFHAKSGLSIAEGPGGEMVMTRLISGELFVMRPSYTAPAVTTLVSVMPRRGPAAGGVRVRITGHHFGRTPTVSFGGVACTNVVVIDDDSLTCVTPRAKANTQVAVVVRGAAGVSASAGADFWNF